MNILIINGPNLNMLGHREIDIYGNKSYKDLIDHIKKSTINKHVKLKFYQTNHEGKIIDYLQKHYHKYDGLIINPGALTHYSYVLRDCLISINKPTIEVHLSNINEREDFRRISVIKDIVNDSIIGLGFESYTKAIDQLMEMIK